jgi:hypothetical protein
VDTPLAGMLPEKYKSVDIKTVFPEFRENSVLRFSTLFPIKVGHNYISVTDPDPGTGILDLGWV